MTSSGQLPQKTKLLSQIIHCTNPENMGAPNTIPSDFDSFSLLQPPSPPASSPSSTSREKGMIYLPEGYIPGPCDVICQRGKDCHEHIGNRRFRACVDNFVDIYLNAKTRQEKSAVISNIVKMINENDHNKQGGFIMKDPKAQRWHHVDIKVARDKVGNALRDAIKQRQEGIKPSSAIIEPMNNACVSQVSRDSVPSWSTAASSRNAELLDDPTSCGDEQLARLVHHSHNVLPTGRVESGCVPAVPTENMFLYPRQVKEQSLEQTPQLLSAFNIMNHAQQSGGHGNYHQLIHLPLLDDSFFSLTSTMEPQRASDSIHGLLSNDAFTLPRNLLPFEALVDSMDVDDFEDFEPRPIGSMVNL